MSDGSWHFWDFMQYYQHFVLVSPPENLSVVQADFKGFSCPLSAQRVTFPALGPTLVSFTVATHTTPRFLFFGGFSSYGTLIGSTGISGKLFQLVPLDYDFNTNPITNFVSLLYPPLSIGQPSIFFRGETLSLGHKISTRRLRIQADNAPSPLIPAGPQLAQVTFTGAGQNSVAKAPTLQMQGNLAPVGLPIQTYYGDAVLSDEMVQPSLVGQLPLQGAPWPSLPLFRIASASLIGIDATSTTQ
jgi:hypothetical protein